MTALTLADIYSLMDFRGPSTISFISYYIIILALSSSTAASENNHNELELTHLPYRGPQNQLTSPNKDDDYVGSHSGHAANKSIYHLTSTRPINSIHKARRPSHCVSRPQNLNFCSKEFGWAENMALPNLLGHRSSIELNEMLAITPSFEMISIVDCKESQQLKLLTCSIMSPICIDMAILPCRSLCTTVRNSCEPSFRNLGLEWPKFLDCRKFTSRSRENCITKQPLVEITGPDVTGASNQTTNSKNPNVTSSRPNAKRRRKDKKNRRLTTTTLAPSTFPSSVTNYGEQVQDNNLLPTGESSMTPTSSIGRDVTVETTTGPAIAATPTTTEPSTTTVGLTTPIQEDTSETTADQRQEQSSSMPVNVTDDLTQLLCSTSPDWLIKTKLTDGQLMNAVRRRKLKVRSYLQIFGLTPANKDGASNLPARPTRSKTNSSNLYLSISNTTIFVAAMGANIYTQPISEALPRSTDSLANSSASMKSVRYYLIAGSESSDTTKPTSVFVVWPSGKTVTTDPSSQGSVNIIKAYREFKRKKSKVCNPGTQSDTDINGESPYSLPTRKKEKRIHSVRFE